MTDPPKPKRGRPRTLDRDRVLDVAMHAYWQDGPESVSINDLCRRAGVSKPSLYREFGGEDGLTEAVLHHYLNTVLSQVMDILTSDQGFGTALSRLIDYASEGPLSENGCLFVKMRARNRRFGPATRALIREIDAAALAAHEAFLCAARMRGDRGGDIADASGADYLAAQINLALARRALGDDPAAIRAMLELAFSVFGVRPPQG